MTASADRNIGRVLGGNYRIEARIGEGGMGTVYRGVQLSVKRAVAIKLLSVFGNAAESQRRFRREAEATAQLDNPHIVRLIEFGVTEQAELFLIMELLSGMDVSQHLERTERMLPAAAFEVCQQVLEALSEAHAKSFFHRDIKPSNIFLCESRTGAAKVKVLDFGIAGLDPSANRSKLTLVGDVLGTPAYMSPEQAQGLSVDARTDLYSLGVALFEMLTGELPFKASTALQFLSAHIQDPPQRLPNIGLTPTKHSAVQSLLDKMLAKDPNQRFASAETARAAIARVSALPDAAPTPRSKRLPPVAWASVATGVLVSALALVLAIKRSGDTDVQATVTSASSATQSPMLLQPRAAGPVTQPTAASSTVQSAVRAHEGLTAAQLEQVVREGSPKLKRCYDGLTLMAAAHPTFNAKIELEIGPSGAVQSTTINEGSPRMKECVARTVKAWTFPSAGDSTKTRFTLPGLPPPVALERSAELLDLPAQAGAIAPGVRLSADDINKVVRADRQSLQRCYDTAQREYGSKATFSMVLLLEIAASGTVTSARVTEGLPGMKDCVQPAATKWHFPRARESTKTRVPLDFGPDA